MTLIYAENKAKGREGRLVVASRLTIEEKFQCWFTLDFSISEEDRTAVTSVWLAREGGREAVASRGR